MQIVLKNGETVETRLMRENEDVFELTRFVNEVHKAAPYLDYLNKRKLTTSEQEVEWLKKSIETISRGRGVQMLAVKGQRVVGISGAECRKEPTQKHTAEFGFLIRLGFRGHGLGYALGRLVLEKCLKKPKIEIIFARTFSTNKASVHVLKKLGFRQAARLSSFYKHGRKRGDRLFFVFDKKRFKQAVSKQKA